MTPLAAMPPAAPLTADPVIARLGVPPPVQPTAGPAFGSSFGDILAAGVRNIDEKLATADGLVRRFALDDDAVPVHQVTYALEQARLSVELAMQVRARMVEGYRELMNMQL